MTKQEWKNKLEQMYEKNPMLARSKEKTVNEFFYMLRMDEEYDYNISMIEDGAWTCVPSVKLTFIPVKTLARHIKSIELDEDDYGCEEICLTIVTEG